MRRFAIGIVFLVMLTACTTGDSGFRTVEGMASRPDMAREIVSQCIDLISLRPRGQREEVAALMGVPAAKVPGAYCGRVEQASAKAKEKARKGGTPNLVGTQILTGLKPIGGGRFRGRAFVPKRNVHATATVRQVGPNVMQVQGCVLAGVLCDNEKWTRVTS